MADIVETARAKINLALHVTGQRADGYHLLETLVVFAETGDCLTFATAAEDSFAITGRFGPSLPQDIASQSSNLVIKARDLLRDAVHAKGVSTSPVHIHLEKNLPIASGIGGGSADAAAALRGLSRLWGLETVPLDRRAIALKLGADVPMCLESRSLVARGIGEDIRLLPHFPSLALLLVNPLVEVSTPAIFRALTNKNNPPLLLPEDTASQDEWLAALSTASNHLGPVAEQLQPAISLALSELEATGPVLARMSGSGATCFGIYRTVDDAEVARDVLAALHPEWYLQATTTTVDHHARP